MRAFFYHLISSNMSTAAMWCLFSGLLSAEDVAMASINKETVAPFIKRYCFDCHGGEKVKGGVNFRDFHWEIGDNVSAQHWQDVLDVLNSGEMPPEDEPQLTNSEHSKTVRALTADLQLARKTLKETRWYLTPK